MRWRKQTSCSLASFGLSGSLVGRFNDAVQHVRVGSHVCINTHGCQPTAHDGIHFSVFLKTKLASRRTAKDARDTCLCGLRDVGRCNEL